MKSLLKLKSYLRPYLWLIIVSAVLAIPLSALRFAPVPLVKYLVDEVLAKRETESLVIFPFVIIGIFLLNFVVRFFHYYCIRIVIAKVNQKLKYDLHNHVLGLSADYFTEKSTGTLMSRVASDPQYIDSGISCINVIIREPITFLFLFGYTLYLDWRLALITFLVFPPLAWLFSYTGKTLKRYVTRMQEENAMIFSSLQESISGIRTIKAFGLHKFVRKKFYSRVHNFTQFLLKTAALQEAAHPAVELITAFAIAGVLFYGGNRVLQGDLTSGGLLAFFTAFGMMMNPIRMLNDVNLKLHQASSACDRIFEIFSWKSTLPHPKVPVSKTGFDTEIKFQDLTFAYPDSPERNVLENVNFTIPKGGLVAIVGESGAGKSSIVNLLPRIFDPTQGKISIDGIDIKNIEPADLRSLFAVVSQDIFLFNDNISENIRCGKQYATQDEIKEAARKAHAVDFIESLPKGFRTTVGDRGQKLSGGERQRVSIARAFLREAPILILDEATSNLDSASEAAVQDALSKLMVNKTTLMIAHRLSTVRSADHIIVLKEGRVVESGRHETLLEKKGEYARFHALL